MKLGKGLRLKAKDLRKKQPKELISMLSNIDMELAKFRGQQALKHNLKTPRDIPKSETEQGNHTHSSHREQEDTERR